MEGLAYRKLTGYKYQTTHHCSCYLPLNLFHGLPNTSVFETNSSYIRLEFAQRTMQISKGYCWDGPSGPTIDTDNFMRGSLFHDAWYQVMRENSYYRDFRDDADQLLMAMCLADGMHPWRARWVYWGVKTFGRRSAGG